jgi:hypothetical protein
VTSGKQSAPKYQIAIVLQGANLEPNDVSERLGILPSELSVPLEQSANGGVRELGRWELALQDFGTDFAVEIARLLTIVAGRRCEFDELPSVEQAHIRIQVWAENTEGGLATVAFQISVEHLNGIAELRLPIEFEIIFGAGEKLSS